MNYKNNAFIAFQQHVAAMIASPCEPFSPQRGHAPQFKNAGSKTFLIKFQWPAVIAQFSEISFCSGLFSNSHILPTLSYLLFLFFCILWCTVWFLLFVFEVIVQNLDLNKSARGADEYEKV